jgi:hypothetical protein
MGPCPSFLGSLSFERPYSTALVPKGYSTFAAERVDLAKTLEIDLFRFTSGVNAPSLDPPRGRGVTALATAR